MKKVIFSNILGSFVFSDRLELIDSIELKTISEYKEKDTYEKALALKHHARKPTETELGHILHQFKKKEYFQRLGDYNSLLSRKAIKQSVAQDGILIQTINAIEELEKVQNLLIKRLREWYALYDPELESRFRHHEAFLEQVQKQAEPDHEGMGGKLSSEDIGQLQQFGAQVRQLYDSKAKLEKYLEQLGTDLCPNLLCLAGPTMIAKLISHAGSLKRLAEMPASTLQVLGAEKALFRHMRNKKKNLPPKHGLIHEHPLIAKSNPKDHGKIARSLADKLSMCARIDFYKGAFIGDSYKEELIKKFGIAF